MISSRAVKKFLERPLDDWRHYKKLKFKELRTLRDDLPIRPPIWKKLQKHQRVCLLLGAQVRRFLFFLDTGMGKTLLSIALIKYFKRLNEATHVLVLVPRKANCSEWVREIKKHSPATTYCVLEGSSEQKWESFYNTDALVLITTYKGLYRMCCKEVTDKKKKRKIEPNVTLMRHLCKKIDGLIMDESLHVQRKDTLAFRICRQVRKQSNFVFALTATPFGRNPASLWGQFFLVDGGFTLSTTLGMFRACFFRETEGYNGIIEYTFNRRMRRKLHNVIAHCSIEYEADEASLPKVVEVLKEIELPHDAEDYAKIARETLRSAHGSYAETKNAFIRMRQISSGFIGYKDDDDGKRAQFDFKPNVKLEMLMSIISDIRRDHKIIVFNDFTFSGSIICRELKNEGIGHVRIWGGTKDTDEALAEFDHNDDVQVMVLNNSMAEGLNLQIAKYGIYYEAPIPVWMRKQTVRRFERQYSKHKTVYLYDLVCLGTYDQKILDAHAEGKDLFETIIKGKFKGKGRRG